MASVSGTPLSGGYEHGGGAVLQVRGSDRRRQRARFVLRERRTGFDRRRRKVPFSKEPLHAVLLYLRDHIGALAVLLIAANLLNVVDYLLTLNALSAPGVEEANPVLRGLFETAPWAAGLLKLTLVGGISLMIWRLRRYRQVLLTSLLLLAVYSGVFLFQLYGLFFVLT